MPAALGKLAALSLVMLSMSANATPPPISLTMVLRHVGEQDAALPRIDITTAAASPSADADAAEAGVVSVRVNRHTYRSLCRLVANEAGVTDATRRTGTFELQASGCPGHRRAVLSRKIGPETFLQLLDLLHQARPPACPVPEAMDGIANIVRNANRKTPEP